MAGERPSWKVLGISLVLVLVTLYALFGARRYLQGPVLTVTSPKEGATVTGPEVRIVGEGANLSYFYINGTQTYLDERGAFLFVYTPPPGDTILTAEGKDRFGRSKKVMVRFHVTN